MDNRADRQKDILGHKTAEKAAGSCSEDCIVIVKKSYSC